MGQILDITGHSLPRLPCPLSHLPGLRPAPAISRRRDPTQRQRLTSNMRVRSHGSICLGSVTQMGDLVYVLE